MCGQSNGCVFSLTLCKYDLTKGDLFVLSWATVRQVWISWGVFIVGGGV